MALIITLILLGIVLLLLGLLIFPGFGVPEILGLVSLVSGVVLAYYTHGTATGHVVLGSTVLLCALLLACVLRSNTWQRLALHENITAQALDTAANKGLTVGMKGTTLTRMAPMGSVRFNDIKTEATAFGGIIQASREVEIVKIEGIKVMVKELKNE
jgi:membrane-bound ClpP family serine protease